jgi:hypothetical protein
VAVADTGNAATRRRSSAGTVTPMVRTASAATPAGWCEADGMIAARVRPGGPARRMSIASRAAGAKMAVMANPSPNMRGAGAVPGQIEVRLRELSQLFNSMDPSPFHERDFDADAEEFIISWALEFPRKQPLKLVIYLPQAPAEGGGAATIAQAVHNYFAYRAELNWREFKQLMRQGRTSLIVGLSFLVACFVIGQLVAQAGTGTWHGLARESLTIGGWVAMWRPLQIYLYEWWPLRYRGAIYRKLSAMDVELRVEKDAGTG